MANCADPKNRTALLVAALAALVGCRDAPKDRGQSAARASAVNDVSAESEPQSQFPPRLVARESGRFAPASWLEGGLRVAAAGSKSQLVVAVARVGRTSIYGPGGALKSEFEVPGTPQVLELVDSNGDGHLDVVLGAGLGRETRDAKATLVIAEGPAFETVRAVELGRTSRSQVVDVAVDGQGVLWAAHFLSKYKVALSTVAAGAHSVKIISHRRMISGIAFASLAGQERLVVARVYGDKRGEPGLAEIKVDRAWQRLPTVRGIRAIRGHGAGLVVAEGWHREYKAKGRAVLTYLSPNADGWTRQPLANVANAYGFQSLDIGDVDGNGVADVVAAGGGPVIAVPVDADGSKPAMKLTTGRSADAAVADIDGDGRFEVLVVGEDGGIWRAP